VKVLSKVGGEGLKVSADIARNTLIKAFSPILALIDFVSITLMFGE